MGYLCISLLPSELYYFRLMRREKMGEEEEETELRKYISVPDTIAL